MNAASLDTRWTLSGYSSNNTITHYTDWNSISSDGDLVYFWELVDYRFFDRPFSLKKILMLKIKTDKGKKITKRFNLTLISEKEIRALSSSLDIVIAKIV